MTPNDLEIMNWKIKIETTSNGCPFREGHITSSGVRLFCFSPKMTKITMCSEINCKHKEKK